MKEYKKSYKGLIIWVIFFIILMIPFGYWGEKNYLDEAMMVRIILVYTMLMMDVLIAMIHYLDKAYWISGPPSYHQAKNASFEKRRIYTRKHLDLFLIITLLYLLILLFCLIFKLTFYIDLAAFIILFIGGAIYSIKFKWDD